MTLINKTIEKAFAAHPLVLQKSKGIDAEILVKYFNPFGTENWYIVGADRMENGDWLMYGLFEQAESRRWDSVLLSVLSAKTVSVMGIDYHIERDKYLTAKTVRDITER